MKHFALAALILAGSTLALAQDSSGFRELSVSSKSDVDEITRLTAVTSPKVSEKTAAEILGKVLSSKLASRIGFPTPAAAHETLVANESAPNQFVIRSVVTDDVGYVHIRFDQFYRGAEVENGEGILHLGKRQGGPLDPGALPEFFRLQGSVAAIDTKMPTVLATKDLFAKADASVNAVYYGKRREPQDPKLTWTRPTADGAAHSSGWTLVYVLTYNLECEANPADRYSVGGSQPFAVSVDAVTGRLVTEHQQIVGANAQPKKRTAPK